MPSAATHKSVLAVIRAVSGDPGRRSAAEAELAGWGNYGWSRVLLHLPTDRHSFVERFEITWDEVIDDLHAWCREFPARPEPERQRLERVFGYLGLLLVTLVSLRDSEAYRYPSRTAEPGTAEAPSHDCAGLCQPLLAEPAVQDAIGRLYAPDTWLPESEVSAPEPDEVARAEWERIDLRSLRFHRHGTTSFILSGLPNDVVHGRRRRLALKCLLYPFLRVPTIVRATHGYRSAYGTPGHDLRHLVRVWASGPNWILMDFVPGDTLADLLAQRHRSAAPPGRQAGVAGQADLEIDLELLADVGRELFTAMADLERAGLSHGDLSPSNIIVARDDSGARSFILVDLGVNFRYVHAVPGLEGADGRYVAPEVRAGGADSDLADLYSVGQILVAAAGGPAPADGTVPDRFYAETPILARFIEDLVDRAPQRRLALFRPDPAKPRYPQLLAFFEEELAAMAAAREGRWEGRSRALAFAADLLRPLAGAPARQRRLWQVRRDQGLYRDPRRGMHVRWLLLWSWVSATAWYVAATVVAIWWLRDLEWDWGNHAITVLQRITDSPPDRFPYLDELRAADYPIPDLLGNLPVRLVGMSFLLVGARYYQNIFAGLTPRVAGLRQGRLSLLAVLAEVQMRMFSVTAFCLVLPPTLIQRDWWPLFTAIGIILTFLCNWTCVTFARTALRRADEAGLSTVPSSRLPGLEAFAGWTPTSAFYACSATVIGLFIYHEVVRDIYVYAGAVTAINVVIFYMIKCSGVSAAGVRAALGRACLAAERLRYVADPPAPSPRPAAD